MEKTKQNYSHYKSLLKVKREQRFYQQLSTLLFNKRPKEGLYLNSLDFLDLHNNSYIQEQALHQLMQWGSGTNSKNLVIEQIEHQYKLEKRISTLLKRDHAFVYQANSNVQKNLLGAFLDTKTLLIIDEDFASKFSHIRHKHTAIVKRNDLDMLEKLLKNSCNYSSTIFIADSISSFTGQALNLQAICDLCKSFGAITFIDDTNSMGLFGSHGMGYCTQFSDVDIVTGSFSKSVGSYACFLATNEVLSDYFSHSNQSIDCYHLLCPAALSLLSCSISLMGHMNLERQRLKNLSQKLRDELRELDFNVCQSESNIISINFRNERRALKLSHKLTKEKIYHLTFSCTLHKRSLTNLRFILNCNHTTIDLKYLLQTLEHASDALMIQVG